MRAWLALAVVLSAGPAVAGPLHPSPMPHDPLIPRWDTPRYTPEAERDGLPAFARLDRGGDEEANAGSGLSFGPVHAESEIIHGHRRIHYRIEGLSLFGGDVGGSVGRRGAMLTLHWASPGH